MQAFHQLRSHLILWLSLGAFCALGQTAPDHQKICSDIAARLQAGSTVSLPGSAQYNSSLKHWAQTSSQPSACTVEPANAAELSTVLQIVAQRNALFAVKSGGHAFNPNFSSTPGILVTTGRFNEVVVNTDAQTAAVGVGALWENVYAELEPHGVTVAGGRVPDVGVGGLMAGGGYSFLTNKIGISVDTVVGYDLVLPNGTVSAVTAASNSELFWALKGGGNNFGVITSITMKTFPQGQIWGGGATILPENIDAVLQAFSNWDAKATDLDASFAVTFSKTIGKPGVTSVITLFYNAETPPAGLFDEFLAIPAASSDFETRSFTNFFATQASAPAVPGLAYDQVPINRFPLKALQAWIAEIENVATALQNTSASTILSLVDHFDHGLLSHASPLPGFALPSSWPPTRDFPTIPSALAVLYTDLADGAAAAKAVTDASDRIRTAAAAAGVTETAVGAPDAAKYPNGGHWSSTPQEIYGSALPKLRELSKKYDPQGLMKRAGGFKFE